ncbi:23S rRNA (uracil-5-)-methyltransferase RumB, partial [Yersinia pestis PY-100]
MRTVYGRGPP